MSLTKVLFFVSLLLLSSLSGCMFLQKTSFTLLSLSVDDDNGFPRIAIEFNISDTAKITLTSPTQTLLFSDTYYAGIQNESMYLSDYRTTVPSGTYLLTAVDTSENTIYEQELPFTGSLLSLQSLSVDSWQRNTISSIVALHLTVHNAGDLPAYPYKVTVRHGVSLIDILLPFSVISPSETTQLTCFVDFSDAEVIQDQLNISLYDNQGTQFFQSIPTILKNKYIDSYDYTWFYLGQHTLQIPQVDWFFEYYQSLDRFEIIDYSAYVFDPYDDQYIDFLIRQILLLRTLKTDVEKINFVASFVQSIEYKNDDPENTSFEYPRFPLETLKEKRGDCEDKAILTAALLTSLGYNVSLIRLPQHMAVGVHLNETIPGYSYYVDGYYFLETTTLHMTLGRVPPEYEGLTNVTVYPITLRHLLVHHWRSATRYQVSTGEDYVQVKMILENLGTAATSNIEVRGAFFDNANLIYNQVIVSISPIRAGQKRQVELSVDVPVAVPEKTTTLKTQLFLHSIQVHQRESTSRFP